MRTVKIILSILALLTSISCIDSASFWRMESAVAKVGDSSLLLSQVTSAIPEGLSSTDSLAFATRYIERWTSREAKIIKAEEVFASSSREIEQMVEEYRRKILLDKLDKHILEQRGDYLIEQAQLEEYYRHNRSQFRVETPLVQYRLLRYDSLYSNPKNLLKLFSSSKESDLEDLRSICEKNGYSLTEVSSWWEELDILTTKLSTTPQSEISALIKSNKATHLKGDKEELLLKITAYRGVGDAIPFELAKEMIKGILLKREQNQTLLDFEEELYHKALKGGKVSFPSTSHIN